MSAPVTIAPARVKDAPAMAAYMAALKAEPGLDTIGTAPAPSVEAQRILVRKAQAAERACILLAWAGEEMVGQADLWPGEQPDVAHAGTLGISVAKAWRGAGLGRRLMAATIAQAKAWEGFCRIELEVTAWNARAIGLYESLGFVVEGAKRKALNRRGRHEDLLVMGLIW